MDPVTILCIAVGAATVGVAAGGKAGLRRVLLRQAQGRTRELEAHRLAVVDDDGRAWVDADVSGAAAGLVARVVDGQIEVRAPITEMVGGLTSVWMRSTDGGPLRLSERVSVGGLPLGDVAAVVMAADTQDALLRLAARGGRLAVEKGELFARMPRRSRVIEADVRAAFDVVAPVLERLTQPARLEAPQETAVSSSGSPFAVRGIDT